MTNGHITIIFLVNRRTKNKITKKKNSAKNMSSAGDRTTNIYYNLLIKILINEQHDKSFVFILPIHRSPQALICTNASCYAVNKIQQYSKSKKKNCISNYSLCLDGTFPIYFRIFSYNQYYNCTMHVYMTYTYTFYYFIEYI